MINFVCLMQDTSLYRCVKNKDVRKLSFRLELYPHRALITPSFVPMIPKEVKVVKFQNFQIK